MTIFFSELLSSNFVLTRFLVGIYYGILTTLPLAPSQLLSVRVLLLEDENQQGKTVGAGAAKGIFIAGMSGFLIAQLAIVCSIYYPSLYQFYFKPHFFNLILPPLLIWHYIRIMEFDPISHLIPNYKYSLLDPRVRTTFLESFVLQIINPIVLPNAVFTRLISVFLFQYSHIPIFVLGSVIGWLSGQILFFYLSYTLLSQLQSDSPSIYRIVKRIVHSMFPPIILGMFLSYIGRVSMVPLPKKSLRMDHYSTPMNVWPDMIYNRNKLSRSTHFMLSPNQSRIRNQTNAPFNTLKVLLHKKHFSQFFFEKCLSDGQQRLLHNYPISLSLVSNDLKRLIKLNDYNHDYIIEKEWNYKKKDRLLSLNKILNCKIIALHQQTGNIFQKKLSSYNENRIKLEKLSQYIKIKIKKKIIHSNELSQSLRKYIYSFHLLNKRISKRYDVRLGNSLRSKPKLLQDESFWLMNIRTRFTPLRVRNYLTRWKVGNQRLKRLKKIILKLGIYSHLFDLSKKVPMWKIRRRTISFYMEFDFFKKNLTRSRRKKFFIRSFVGGTTSGRSRNINNKLIRLLDNKPRSSFFLRSKEMNIDNKDANSIQRISQTASEKFDFANSHSIRGPALITQAFIRKYIKLPLLITGKSLIRLMLLQISEWDQDWEAWKNEKYVYCFYSGSYFSDDDLPPQWFGDGLQIKILFPFHITPWHLSLKNKEFLLKTNPLLLQSSYINIWGQETDVPFGQRQSIPFIKPIIKAVILLTQRQLGKIIKNFYAIYCNFKQPFTRLKQKWSFQKNHIVSLQEQSLIRDHQNLHTINSSLSKNSTLPYQNYDANNNVTQISEESLNFPKHKFNVTNHQNENVVSFIQGKEILINIDTKNSKIYTTFPNSLIFQKKKKFLEYQQIKLQMRFIDLKQKYAFIQKKLFRSIDYVLFALKKKTLQSKKEFIQSSLELIKLFSKYQCFINRYLATMSMQNLSSDSLNLTLLNLKKYLNKYETENTLSNAYILHKIWQMNMPNKVSIKNLLREWNVEQPLENSTKIILNKYGLVADQPINSENLQEWLKNLKRYTPSPDIWDYISPILWRKKIHDLFKTQDIDVKYSIQSKKRILTASKKYLSYHKPLFEITHKINKRWDTNVLISSYINSLKENTQFNLLSSWENENNESNQSFIWKIIQKHSQQKDKTSHIGHSLASLNKFNFHLQLSKPLINSMHFSSVYTKNWHSIKKRPLVLNYTSAYSDTRNLVPFKLANFKQRSAFKPIRQYRWKSEEDRFKVLNTIDVIKKIKSDIKNTTSKNALSKSKNVSSYKTIPGQAKESSFQWQTLDLSTFSCQSIKKRQSKLLDDEILMHNVITSFLEFKKKYFYLKNLKLVSINTDGLDIFNRNFISDKLLIPEDVFLNKTLKEYRILSYLNFKVDTSLKTNLNLFASEKHAKTLTKKTINVYKYDIIKRYLWPSSKLEDLACFNRFLINTANQSRFSILRIKMYPDF